MNKKIIRLTESDLHRIVKKSVQRIINEAFKSPKLAAMAKQHGGIRGGNKHGDLGAEASAWINGENLSLSELTDDMIGDKVIPNGSGYEDNAINFKDGSYVPVNVQAASQMQKNWNDNNPYKYEYSHSSSFSDEPNNLYQKRLQPTHIRNTRMDLQTANNVRNGDDEVAKRNWGKWEKGMRPQINKIYNMFNSGELKWEKFAGGLELNYDGHDIIHVQKAPSGGWFAEVWMNEGEDGWRNLNMNINGKIRPSRDCEEAKKLATTFLWNHFDEVMRAVNNY
jgi:hypothetical protein